MKIIQVNKSAVDDFRTVFCRNDCAIPEEVDGITFAVDRHNTMIDYEMYDTDDSVIVPGVGTFYDLHRLFNFAVDATKKKVNSNTTMVESLVR
tara:strand:- start:116 stop:394 length:279 start_codon:yes stop_codon:yes gene_type:complete